MSQNYIRIYCNGKKVRSTGAEKWYRDHILLSFGIGLKDSTVKKSSDKILCGILSSIPNDLYKSIFGGKIHYSIEYVRRTNAGVKKSIGFFWIPYFIKQERLNTISHLNYQLVKNPVEEHPKETNMYYLLVYPDGDKIKIPLFVNDPSEIPAVQDLRQGPTSQYGYI